MTDRPRCACGAVALYKSEPPQCLDCWRRDHTFVCTAADPWHPDKVPKGDHTVHPDAVSGEDRDFGGGEYCESYTCPNCGHHFYVELPQ